MPLKLLPVTLSDAPTLASIHYTSTLSSSLTQLLYGDVNPAELQASINRSAASKIKEAGEEGNHHRLMKVVDTDLGGGEMISYADWVLPAEGDDEERKDEAKEQGAEEKESKGREEAPAALPKGINMAVREEFMKEIGALRERFLGKLKHYLLGNLATHPSHQGRGAASMLIKWPFEEADEAGVIIYLDTDLNGQGINLYKKLGFKQVDECHLDLDNLGGHGTHTHVGMIREPGTPYS